MKTLLFLLLASLTLSGSILAQQLITYPAPDSARRAADFSMKVNGQSVFVYDNAVSAMASFSFQGTVTVEITSTHDLRWVDIRPKHAAIAIKVTPNTITFKLDKPGQFSIERNGEHSRPLYVFAAPFGERRT